MNNKTAKLLRKFAKNDKKTYKRLKRKWKAADRNYRAFARNYIQMVLAFRENSNDDQANDQGIENAPVHEVS